METIVTCLNELEGKSSDVFYCLVIFSLYVFFVVFGFQSVVIYCVILLKVAKTLMLTRSRYMVPGKTGADCCWFYQQ